VVLASGKIALSLPEKKETILMQPGELVEVNDQMKSPVKKVVRPETYSSWKENEWNLDDQSLEEIAGRIEDTFGLEVIIKNESARGLVVNASVPTNDLKNLLDALSATFGIKITRTKDQVIIE
jgi:ferric-dicitrate binding protein FerR (iron transport regulator)